MTDWINAANEQSDEQLILDYNHNVWLGPGQNRYPANFDASPPLGAVAPDFPLWHLNGQETSLSALWSSHLFTVVEFGSFT